MSLKSVTPRVELLVAQRLDELPEFLQFQPCEIDLLHTFIMS
jgi:hypothetical protein